MKIKLLDKVWIIVNKNNYDSEDFITTKGIVLNCSWAYKEELVIGLTEGCGIGLVHPESSIPDYTSKQLSLHHVKNLMKKHKLIDIQTASVDKVFSRYKELLIYQIKERYV